MSYVATVLQPNEKVVYETGLHWLVYLPSLVFCALAIAAAIGALFMSNDTQSWGMIVAAFMAAIAFTLWLPAVVKRSSTEFAVTDQRVIYKAGIFARHSIEMNRNKVESVDVDQSILGRIFGYGKVTIRGTGGGLEPVADISDPLTFRSHLTAV